MQNARTATAIVAEQNVLALAVQTLEKLCGVETTDARKAHLSQHYNEYIEMQEKLPADKRVTVDKVFDNVFERYQQSLPGIKAAIDKAAVKAKELPQAQTQTFKQSPTLKTSKI